MGQVQEKSHYRSGATQQWREAWEQRHISAFKHLHGADLIALGYEASEDW
ncbi:MAG: hypothetical protein AAGJ46_01530 [Planctomycetota bacterium]